jgi:DNA-binding CsgD family transcriptional regulator
MSAAPSPEHFRATEPAFLPMCAVDDTLVLRSWTPAMEELTGIEEGDAVGRPCYEVLRLESDGKPLCGEACELVRALKERSLPTIRRVAVQRKGGKRSYSMVTFGTDCPDRGEVMMHAFQESADAAPQRPPVRVHLTPRQLEILRMLDRGLMSKQIAVELGISKHTVDNHVQAINKVLGVPSRISALSRARRLGLL